MNTTRFCFASIMIMILALFPMQLLADEEDVELPPSSPASTASSSFGATGASMGLLNYRNIDKHAYVIKINQYEKRFVSFMFFDNISLFIWR